MKIEKISDTQVKFILSEEDLAGKDIKLEDLAVSNDKTKELFQDILSKALDECGFAVDDAPLMVEALPVAIDSIMIIVTKLGSEENQSEKTDASAPIISKDLHRYKRNSIKIHTAESFDDSNSAVYSFDALDDVIDACVKKAQEGIWGYTSRPDSYFEAVQEWEVRRNGWKPDTALMSWSLGVVPAMSAIVKLFSKDGDKILIQTPVYSEF